jgi:hypothetical protein
MRSNDRVTLPALMTLIGTSNRSVAELVRDGTGMRRFYELPVPGKCDWHTLNHIDYALLWSAISEDDEAPGIVHKELLMTEQAKLTWRHPVDRWLDEESFRAFLGVDNVHYESASPENGVTTAELFQRFIVWCKANGEREGRSEELGRQLIALGWMSYRGSRAAGQKPSYRRPPIDAAHPAHPVHHEHDPMANREKHAVCRGVQSVQGEHPLSVNGDGR